MIRILIGVLTLVTGMAAADPLEARIEQTRTMLAAHRASVSRLNSAAQASSQTLLQGGDFFLCCDGGAWVAEGFSRAGGLMGVKETRSPGQVRSNSLVWISYTADKYQSVRQTLLNIPAKVTVVLFGPKPPAGPPKLAYWIDSLTPWDAADDLTLLGNVLSFWSLTGELATATASQGKTLMFFQSVWTPSAAARNALYKPDVFHKSGPRMEATKAGVASSSYLDFISTMIEGIAKSELPAIRTVGSTKGAREKSGKPAMLVVTSHLVNALARPDPPLYQFESEPAAASRKVSKSDYVVALGYSAIDADLFQSVHKTGAGAAWITAASAPPSAATASADIFISQHWEPVDAAVKIPGYDIAILPPSGIAQLFIYDLLLLAAETGR